jgi:hypothetical protein
MKIKELEEAIVEPKMAKDYTVNIAAEKALAILQTHCSDALDVYTKPMGFGVKGTAPTLMYKGLRGFDKPYFAMDPSKIQRESDNTTNFYTQYLSNYSPNWKTFPPRDRSIICSSTKNYASTYGTLYIVFPENGSTIGICSGQDFWESFERGAGIDSMGRFAKIMSSAFNLTKLPMEKFLAAKLKQVSYMGWGYSEYLSNNEYFRKYSPDTTIGEALEDLLDPNKNGFKMITTSDLVSMPDNKEVWTSGRCILVKYNFFNKMLKGME